MDYAVLALLAQHAAMTDHHLECVRRVAKPDGHQMPAPLGETVILMWEVQMVKQVRRAGRLANQFMDTLDAHDAEWNEYVEQVT